MEQQVLQGYYRNDSFLEKIVFKKTFWLLISLFFFGYPIMRSVNRTLPDPLPVYYNIPEFKLTNEHGQTFGSNDLNGKVYIANFFFSSCPTSCPKLMGELQKIQKRMKGVGQKAAIVSFTVDPKHDTPETLFKYSRKLHSNPWVWSFLTGPMENVYSVITKGFKVAMGDAVAQDADIYDIAHSEKLLLVDQKGRLRGVYSLDKNSINQLMLDVGLLVNNSFNRQI